jgi:hypothetical protein
LEGELQRLERACEACRGLNRTYVLLAIYLAIETGMRLQEIFNLTWPDVDIQNRRIAIRKSKTDRVSDYDGRTIVMNVVARALLAALHIRLIINFRYSKEDRIFPMTREAFKQSWADVVKRADIEDLHFHDLRREAGSRFDEAGLTRGEHDLMMGHANKDMASLYIRADLKSIQDKLDRHRFGGKTWQEVEEDINERPGRKQFDECLHRGVELWGEYLESGRHISLPAALNKAVEEMKAGLREQKVDTNDPQLVVTIENGSEVIIRS